MCSSFKGNLFIVLSKIPRSSAPGCKIVLTKRRYLLYLITLIKSLINKTHMDTQPKLICKAEKTNLSTTFPAYYFGAKNAKVYVVYSILWGGTNVLVAAKLEEFSFNYGDEKLFNKNRPVLIPEAVLNGNEKMTEIRTARFDKDKLPEIVAKSFLHESLDSTLSADKLAHPDTPEGK
jgi:hypothetical protein